MKFLRHGTQQGRKYDTSEASSDSVLVKTRLFGDSDVFSSSLENSVLLNTLAYKASIVGCTVKRSRIIEATVEYSKLTSTSLIGPVQVENCQISNVQISGKAKVRGLHAKNIIIGKSCVARDWGEIEYDGQGCRIMRGVWDRPPRVFRMDSNDTTVTESVNRCAFIGCIEKPMVDWIRKGSRLARLDGWSTDDVAVLTEVFEGWMKE